MTDSPRERADKVARILAKHFEPYYDYDRLPANPREKARRFRAGTLQGEQWTRVEFQLAAWEAIGSLHEQARDA